MCTKYVQCLWRTQKLQDPLGTNYIDLNCLGWDLGTKYRASGRAGAPNYDAVSPGQAPSF